MTRAVSVTPEMLADFARRRANGDRVKAIAADYGLHRVTVSLIAKKHGIPFKPPIAKLDRDALQALLAEGLSHCEIARRHGLSRAGLYFKIQRLGLHTPTPRAQPEWRA